MFRNIMTAWKSHSSTIELVNEFLEMIDRSSDMFTYACNKLSQKKMGKHAQKKIFESDKYINTLQFDIRRQVLVNLATLKDSNLPSCLVLLMVSKDAERIGDYVKNLFELLPIIKKEDVSNAEFKSLFDEIGSDISNLFVEVHEAFENSDIVRAEMAMEAGNKIAVACQNRIEEAINESSARRAVVIALGARYMKRISRHLTNIASSIVNPLPKVDYAGETV